jgi:hypothetical protein
MKISWGKGIVIFFIIFFIWIFLFVFFAMRQNLDLVTDDYYQKGAKYSGQIEINKRSFPYLDSLQIYTTENQIQIRLCKQLESSADSMEVYFFKSSDKTKDIRFQFVKGDSLIAIDKSRLVHGRYQVFITWKEKGEKFSVTKIVDIE